MLLVVFYVVVNIVNVVVGCGGGSGCGGVVEGVFVVVAVVRCCSDKMLFANILLHSTVKKLMSDILSIPFLSE